MGQSDLEKFRMFEQSPLPGSAEEALERDLREAFDSMRDRRGRKLDYDVSRKKTNPGRTLAAKLAKAKRSGIARRDVLKVERAFQRYIDRTWPDGSKYGNTG